MKTSQVVLFVATMMFAGLTTATGTTYKWTDDNGQVQYTQLPPNDRPYTVIKNVTRTTEGEVGEESSASASASASTKKDEAKSGAAGYSDAEKEKLTKNCDIAKQNKEMLRTAAKIRVTDEKGEPRHLTDEERKARLADTEKQISFYCKD